jgi:hypothetical protein
MIARISSELRRQLAAAKRKAVIKRRKQLIWAGILLRCGEEPTRANRDFYGTALRPKVPTQATPGTSERIAIYADRYAKRQDFHHPKDARLELRAAFI